MILDPRNKSGRGVMMAPDDKIAAVEAIMQNPLSSEDKVSDASNDLGLYRGICMRWLRSAMGMMRPSLLRSICASPLPN